MTSDKGALTLALVKEFNELTSHKGKIEVIPQFVGTYEEGLNKLRTALLAKRGPHIAQITDIGTQVMIDSGRIRPLDDFSKQDPQFPFAQLLSPIRRYYEVQGRLYSLPFATSTPVVYYNEDLFHKAGITRAPETFAELEAISRKLTNPAQRTSGITWPLHSWFFEQFLARQGKDLVNQGNGREGRATEVNFTVPEALDFVNLWASMAKEGTFANVGRGWDPAEQNFLAGRSAMLITSSSDVFDISSKAPFRVATAAIPTRDPKVKGGVVIGGNSLWILRTKPEEEQRASYEFLKFMASKEVQKRWHTGTGYLPIRKDVIAELDSEGFYRKFPAARTAITELEQSAEMDATSGALIGNFAEVRESVESAIEKVLAGMLDAKTALSQAKDETDRALLRYNRGVAGR